MQGEWVSISGIAILTTEREKVHKYYSIPLKAWMGDLGDGTHNGGPNDPVPDELCVELTVADRGYCSKGPDCYLHGFESVICGQGVRNGQGGNDWRSSANQCLARIGSIRIGTDT
jgi:hypothetical protein